MSDELVFSESVVLGVIPPLTAFLENDLCQGCGGPVCEVVSNAPAGKGRESAPLCR